MLIITSKALTKTFERQELLDLISDAITDSMDMDWNSSIGARYVLEALIKDNIFIEVE